MCRCQILFAQVNCDAAQQQQQQSHIDFVYARALTTCTQSIFNLIRLRAFTLVTLAHNYHVLFFLLFSHGLRRECDNYIALLNMRRLAHWRSIRCKKKSINKNTRSLQFPCVMLKQKNQYAIYLTSSTPVRRSHFFSACCLCGFSCRIWTHLSTENGNIFLVGVSTLCSDYIVSIDKVNSRCCVQCSTELIFYHLIRKICKCQFMFVVSHAHTGEWMERVGRRDAKWRATWTPTTEHNKSFDQTRDAIGRDRANKCRAHWSIYLFRRFAYTIGIRFAHRIAGTLDMCPFL